MNRFSMKLFSTSNTEIITYCREQFNFELPSVTLARHTSLFLDTLASLRQLLDGNVMRTKLTCSFWLFICSHIMLIPQPKRHFL